MIVDRYGRPTVDIVEWVAHHLPLAIEWAEQEAAQTAAARLANLNRYVETGRCPLGHDWSDVDVADPYPRGGRGCGYCVNAARHAQGLETHR